ncbi:hypothetical protein Q5530_02845 [Saccharothrix sp. BKS2]|uniref:hypothetical protein n=1 Tax=Saccharothrix sp. BKS2 TaxID=3064400 RepID=UPI0039E9F018
MSEAELREGLRAAVGDEPPLHFDPDELIRRGRHERKRRRALIAVGVATLALTGTVLSLPGLLAARPGAGPPGIDAAAAPVLTTTAEPAVTAPTPAPLSASQAPPPVTRLAAASPADLRLLADYASQRVVGVVPTAKVLRAEFAGPRDQERPGYVTGYVQFVDEQGVSRVTAQLSAPPLLVTRKRFCADFECAEARTLTDGSHLEFATLVEPDGRRVTYSVAHFRTDGSVVQMSAYNNDPVDGSRVRGTVSLNGDQLAKLATDPGFSGW